MDLPVLVDQPVQLGQQALPAAGSRGGRDGADVAGTVVRQPGLCGECGHELMVTGESPKDKRRLLAPTG